MEELLEVLEAIKDGVANINSNLEELRESVEEIKGDGLYNTLTDVCDKLDEIEFSVYSIKLSMD